MKKLQERLQLQKIVNLTDLEEKHKQDKIDGLKDLEENMTMSLEILRSQWHRPPMFQRRI
jgi:hypothetical protein